jgi:hypothetical protein
VQHGHGKLFTSDRRNHFEQRRDDSWNSWENHPQDNRNLRAVQDSYLVKGSTLALSQRSQSPPSFDTDMQSSILQAKQHHGQLGLHSEFKRERHFQQTRPHHLVLRGTVDDVIVEETSVPTAEQLVTTAFEFESPEMKGIETKSKDDIEEDDNYMRVEITDFNNTEQ